MALWFPVLFTAGGQFLWADSWTQMDGVPGLSNIYVNVSNAQASDTNSGYRWDRPLASAARAAAVARALSLSGTGSRIRFEPGIYRITNATQKVQLDFPRSLASPPVIFEAAQAGTVWFTASATFTNWAFAGGNRWTHPWSANWRAMDISPMVSNTEEGRRREVVVIGGKLFRPVLSLGVLVDGTFFADTNGGLLHVATPSSPALQGAEISVYPDPENYNNWLFKAQDVAAHNLLFRGLGFRGYAGGGYGVNVTAAPLVLNNVTNVWVDQCTFTHNTGMGLYLGTWGSGSPRALVTRDVLLTGCRFLTNGILGASVGNAIGHQFRDCEFSGNGFQGMWGQSSGALYTGIKTMSTRDLVFSNCRFLSNGSAAGLWLDTDNSQTSVVDCLFAGNRGYGSSGTGAYVENNQGPILFLRSRFLDNPRGFTLSGSSNVTLRQCLLASNDLTQLGVLAFVRDPGTGCSNWLTGELYGQNPPATVWPTAFTLDQCTLWAETQGSLVVGEAATWVQAGSYAWFSNGYRGTSNRFGHATEAASFHVEAAGAYATGWFGNWQRWSGEAWNSRWVGPLAPVAAPVGRWLLSETSGTNFAEISGLSPATATAPVRPTNLAGRQGLVLVTNRLSIPDDPRWRLTNGFTLAAWIYVVNDPPSNNSPLFSRREAWRVNCGWGMYGGPQLWTNGAYGGGGTGNFPTNQWVHLTCTWDRPGGTLAHYRNGSLVRIETNGAFTSYAAPTNTGSIDFSTSWPTGGEGRVLVLSDLQFYNTPMAGDALDRVIYPWVAAPLATPRGLMPGDGLTTNTQAVTFRWDPVADAVAYRVGVRDRRDGTVVTTNLVWQPQWALSNLSERAYDLTVSPVDSGGYVTSNFQSRFDIDLTPPTLEWDPLAVTASGYLVPKFRNLSPDIATWSIRTDALEPKWSNQMPARVAVAPSGTTTLTAWVMDYSGNTTRSQLVVEAPRHFQWVGDLTPGPLSHPGLGWSMAYRGGTGKPLLFRVVDPTGRVLAEGPDLKPGLDAPTGTMAWDGRLPGNNPYRGPVWLMLLEGGNAVLVRRGILLPAP